MLTYKVVIDEMSEGEQVSEEYRVICQKDSDLPTSSKKIISFDVGIKNMAYCIFHIYRDPSVQHSPSKWSWSIIDWNTINLLEEPPIHKTCTYCLDNRRKFSQTSADGETPSMPRTFCNKRAKYEKEGSYYCEKHGKKSGYMMPSKNTYPTYLKKQKIGELYKIALLYNIEDVSLKEKKQDLIQKILDFFNRQCLNLIENKQPRNSNKESIITIARNIRDKFDAIETMKGVTDVLIENQISPIASRMSTIQGLLTQYFVMRNLDDLCNIEFISSRNKLKNYDASQRQSNPCTQVSDREKYKNHKIDSIAYTKQLLDQHPECKHKWETILETTKKDDLADSFLQGIWYIENSLE